MVLSSIFNVKSNCINPEEGDLLLNKSMLRKELCGDSSQAHAFRCCTHITLSAQGEAPHLPHLHVCALPLRPSGAKPCPSACTPSPADLHIHPPQSHRGIVNSHPVPNKMTGNCSSGELHSLRRLPPHCGLLWPLAQAMHHKLCSPCGCKDTVSLGLQAGHPQVSTCDLSYTVGTWKTHNASVLWKSCSLCFLKQKVTNTEGTESQTGDRNKGIWPVGLW